MSSIRLQIKDNIMHYLCDDWNNHKRGKAHKENQAIFDRKDGYACWLNTDLEMVMEKVVKGIYATDFEAYEKQIRDDAIDEILNLNKLNHYDIYNELMYQSVKTDDIEQLKETNNE